MYYLRACYMAFTGVSFRLSNACFSFSNSPCMQVPLRLMQYSGYLPVSLLCVRINSNTRSASFSLFWLSNSQYTLFCMAHAITAVATVVTLAASAAAACLQSRNYHIQSRNHVNSIIPQWSATCSHPCRTNSPFVNTSTAHSSLRRIKLRQTILLLRLANCVELCLVMYSLVRHKQLSSQD